MPGRRTISFDGTSLQSSTIVTKNFLHESIDGKDSNYQRLAARDGAKLVGITFAPKNIELSGSIVSTDIETLESEIDSLKALLNRREKNLDIEYASGTRRYKATLTSLTIQREHYHLTYAPFSAVFTVGNPPFGTTLDTSTVEFNSISRTGTGTYSGNLTFTGTYRAFPIIKVIVNSEANLNKIEFRNVNTDSRISVSREFNAGDILLINTDDYTVTVNGVSVAYDGVFPDFIQGGNDFRMRIEANTCNIDLRIIYRALYL